MMSFKNLFNLLSASIILYVEVVCLHPIQALERFVFDLVNYLSRSFIFLIRNRIAASVRGQ